MRSFAKSYIKCFNCGLVFSAVFSAHGKAAENMYDKVRLGTKWQCPSCHSWSCRQYIRGDAYDKPVYDIFSFMDAKTIDCDIDTFKGIIKCICKREFKTLCRYATYALSCLKKVDPYTLFVELDEKNGSLEIRVLPCDKEDTAITDYTYDFLSRWHDMLINEGKNNARISCHMEALPSATMNIMECFNTNKFISSADINVKDKLSFTCIINEAFTSPTRVEFLTSKSNKIGSDKFMLVNHQVIDDQGNYRYEFYYTLGPTDDIKAKDVDLFINHIIRLITDIAG